MVNDLNMWCAYLAVDGNYIICIIRHRWEEEADVTTSHHTKPEPLDDDVTRSAHLAALKDAVCVCSYQVSMFVPRSVLFSLCVPIYETKKKLLLCGSGPKRTEWARSNFIMLIVVKANIISTRWAVLIIRLAVKEYEYEMGCSHQTSCNERVWVRNGLFSSYVCSERVWVRDLYTVPM